MSSATSHSDVCMRVFIEGVRDFGVGMDWDECPYDDESFRCLWRMGWATAWREKFPPKRVQMLDRLANPQ